MCQAQVASPASKVISSGVDHYTTWQDNPFVPFDLHWFGPALEWVRKSRGRTQQSLAGSAAVNVSRTAIGGYESGKIKPSIEVFLAILRELDITLATFERVALQLEAGRLPSLDEVPALSGGLVAEPVEPYRLDSKRQQFPWAPEELLERWARLEATTDSILRAHHDIQSELEHHRRLALQRSSGLHTD